MKKIISPIAVTYYLGTDLSLGPSPTSLEFQDGVPGSLAWASAPPSHDVCSYLRSKPADE